MVDETKAPDVAAAVPAVETAAPVSTPEITQSSANVQSTTAASVPSEAAGSSAATPAVVAEAPKAETVAESVLGAEPATTEKKADAQPDAKVAETKTLPEGDKAAEAPKVELPTYEEFKLPENAKFDKEPLDAFTKILGELETSKLDHKGMQDVGQKLIDLAAKNTLDSINRLNDTYVQIHNDQKANWFKALKADPEMGGDKIEATIGALQGAVAEYGGNEAQKAALRKMVNDTGVTNNPDLCRLIYNMQQKINKYTTENNGPSIVPGAKPAPTKVKPYQAFYSGGVA